MGFSNIKVFLLSLILLLSSQVEAAQTVIVDPSAGSCADTGAANTGNGTCTIASLTGYVPTQTFTFTATNGGPNATFSVVGSVSGTLTATTSGGIRTIKNLSLLPLFNVTLSDGGTPYVIGDNFAVTITQGTQLKKSTFDLFTLGQICANGCAAGANQFTAGGANGGAQTHGFYKDVTAGDTTAALNLDMGNSGSNQGKSTFTYTNAAASGAPTFGLLFAPRNNANSTSVSVGKWIFSKVGASNAGTYDLSLNDGTNFGVFQNFSFNGSNPTITYNGAEYTAGSAVEITKNDNTGSIRVCGTGNAGGGCFIGYGSTHSSRPSHSQLYAGGVEAVDATSTGVAIWGTTTNDSAAAGYVGQYIESLVSTSTNVPGATVTWGNTGCQLTSLPAGDWDVNGIMDITQNGATLANDPDFTYIAVSKFSATTTTDHAIGSNVAAYQIPNAGTSRTANINGFRVSNASATTIYFKIVISYSAGNPQYRCRLSARRSR